ncbi:MAG: glycoside hydrolase domain-containing protein [Gaiellaceae bacterium]
MRGLGVLALAVVLVLPASVNAAESSMRAGVFTGYAFDACSAPATSSLQAWAASPYRGLGIYIGGVNRACKQPNLTSSWVQATTGLGWSLLPLYVGLQAPCVGQSGVAKISTSATTAASQGTAAADDAAAKAQALGLPSGSPIWFDMEGYHLGDTTCSNAVRSFAGAWGAELHAQGFLAGVYGSAASTIRDVAQLGGAVPDVIWIANWNGNESVFGDPYVSDTLWANHQRVHQYKGGHKETYGGVTINIDSNVVDSVVVGGIVPPAPPPQPAPAGQVNSGDGLATASWPAAAFPAPVVVTLTPAAQPPVANGYSVQLTVTETDNQAPLDGFGAPVTVHLLKPATGLTPAFSTDGTTWQPLTRLTATGLTESQLMGYTLDPDGTAEIQTLVPGWFGLVSDTTPPSAPSVAGRLAQSGLYLSWQAATDDGAVATYEVLRNGVSIMGLPPTARRATVRKPSTGAQTVYRVRATDAAGNVGPTSRPVVILTKKRPAGLPRAIPHWAFGLYAFQRHQGARPKTAPKRPPAWYWRWAAWRAQPYRLR